MSTQAQHHRQTERDSTGKYTSYTPSDSAATLTGVDGGAGSVGAVTPDQSPNPGSDSSRTVSAEATGFEADLYEALPDGLTATVHEDGEGTTSYVLGEGEVSISQTPEGLIELDGGKHRTPPRLVVEDHTGSLPRTVVSGHDNGMMNSYTASRAVEHFESVRSGRDPLTEAQQADTYPARDGLPASYGFDLRERSHAAQALARGLSERFDDEGTDVSAYDSGGGNEIIGIRGRHPETGRGYEVMVSSRDGGSLDEDGWAVGADYEQDGEWGHSDLSELYETEISSSAAETTEAVEDALSRAREKAGHPA